VRFNQKFRQKFTDAIPASLLSLQSVSFLLIFKLTKNKTLKDSLFYENDVIAKKIRRAVCRTIAQVAESGK
jgi:hypothetical protein